MNLISKHNKADLSRAEGVERRVAELAVPHAFCVVDEAVARAAVVADGRPCRMK